ncbi:hypothetical protein BH23GEM4_BH23GEM4_10500 [soil metagenome]
MGESQATLFAPQHNRSIRVEARRERLSSDAGALLLRELMDRLGYPALVRRHLSDSREMARVTHPQAELLRTALLLLAQGWSDHSDVELLRDDPVLRLAVSSRRSQRPLRAAGRREPAGLCSQPTLSRLLAGLGSQQNRAGLGALLLEAAERRLGLSEGTRLREITLDLDSIPLEVFGRQPGSAWNGHYGQRCYHPLVVRSHEGDYLGAKLRPGNAHTAAGGLDFVLPILRRARRWAERVWLRIDAGFPEPRLLGTLEAEGFRYVARLKGNARLARLAAPHLKRPPGRPPAGGRVWTHELRYRADSWTQDRRVVLVLVERAGEQGSLFLDHFFLLTNAPRQEIDAHALLERYRQRGTAEKDFGDFKQALDVSLSSTPRPKSHYQGRAVEHPYEEPDSFAANEARLLLSLIAANLLHAGAALLEREGAARMSRERFRRLVLKSAARVLISGRRITVVIEAARARAWTRCAAALDRLYPARGPPTPRALPSPV